MRKTYLLWFACLAILLGCRNEDFTTQNFNSKREEEFFREAISKTSRFRNGSHIVDALKKQNEKSHFVSEIKDQSGLPIWDKMITIKKPGTLNKGEDESGDNDFEKLVIPLTENEKGLSSVLYVTKYPDGSYTFNNINNVDLKQIIFDTKIDKAYRERLLSSFIVVDNLSFSSDATYWNIPDDLFTFIPQSDIYPQRRFQIKINNTETGGETNNLMDSEVACYTIVIPCSVCDEGAGHDTFENICFVVHVGSGGAGSYDDGSTGTGGGGNNGGGSSEPGGGNTGTGNPGTPGNNGGSDSNGCGEENHTFYKIVPGCDDDLPPAIQSLKNKLLDYEYYISSYTGFLSENIGIANKFNTYLNQNNNQTGAQFVFWGLGFFSQNPNTTWEQFENWFIKGGMDYKNAEDVTFASNLSSVSYDLMYHNQSGTLNQLDIAWPKMDNVRNKIKEKFKNSIPVAVKYTKHLFSTLKTLTDNYPILLTYANKGIDKMRNEIHNEGLINYDVHTMKWKDVVGCWLFELGNYPVNTTTGYNLPTLGFAGSDYVIAGIPGNASQMRFLMNHKTLSNGATSPNSVVDIKRQAINKIKNGNYSSTSGNWGFGFDATIDTISQLDGLQFCLGSYLVTVYVTQISTKTFELTFVVKNKTGWESGTRGLNNGDGNSSNDSVIQDKPRGQGLHLGGTIGETFGWKETITIP